MAAKYHLPDAAGTPRSEVAESDYGFEPSQQRTPHQPRGAHHKNPSAVALDLAAQQDSPRADRTLAASPTGGDRTAAINRGLLSIPERDNQSHADVSVSRDPGGRFGTSRVGPAISPSGAHHVSVAVRHDEDGTRKMSFSSSDASARKGKSVANHSAQSSLVQRSSTMLQASTPGANEDIAAARGDDSAPPGMIHPNNPWLLAWSYLIMFVSIYNTFTIPYRMAFWTQPVPLDPDVVLLVIMDALGDACFFLEIFLNSRTGYVDNGVVVFDRRKIWQRYMHSWFFLDLLTCLPTDLAQLGWMTIIPWLRAFKILRLFQVLHHYNHIEENTTVSLQFRIGKLLFYTAVLSHITACIKYHVILVDSLGTTDTRDSMEHKSGFGRYLQAMYWATGAMTGRDDTNPPENLADAGFTVLMMVVGILWLAYIIASLETFAHDGNNSTARFQAKVGYVTAFMHQFALPREIQDKVKAYYSYLWSSTLRFETEHFLQTLPQTLQADVQLSLNKVLSRAEIFEGVDSGFLALIVHTLSTIVSIPGEIICTAGQVGDQIFFITEGEVQVLIGVKQAAIATLRAGDEFGAYSVLSGTPRSATVRSVSYCTLLVLTSANLQKALVLFPASDLLVREHVEEHRNKTLLQERNFLGLDSGAPGAGANGKKNANAKLKKLITVDEHVATRGDSKWTISPTDKRYEVWQGVMFFFVGWNALALPVRFGFFPHEVNAGVMVVDYLGDLFLLADIVLSFRVRFVLGGAEVTDTALIAHQYTRGWFAFHVIASLPLDLLMLVSGYQPLYRLNRNLRLAHVHSLVLDKLKDATHYEVMSLMYLVFNFLFLSHWAASIYFAFTEFEGFEPNWTYGPHEGHGNFDGWRPAEVHRNGIMVYQYLQSQYYAMSLLAGIGRHLYPPTDYDVVLSLSLMLTGVFVVSYLIGKVGHLIYQLNASAAEFKAEASFVTQLLDYRKVSPDVSTRVTEFMKHTWSSQKGIDPNVALRGLPTQIRTDIMMHICEGMIRAVPRFKDLDDSFVRQLVGELTFVELPAKEYVFRQGQIGDSMYFISKGLVEILFEASPKPVNASANGAVGEESSPRASPSVGGSSAGPTLTSLKIIGQGSFFGEGALFSGTRAASVRAKTPVRLLALSEASFQKVMIVHPHFAEKIMFLNTERQKKLGAHGEGRQGQAKEGRRSGEKSPGAPYNKRDRLSPRLNGNAGGTPASEGNASPRSGIHERSVLRAQRKVSVAVMRPLGLGLAPANTLSTGLASKVEKLLQAEKEKASGARGDESKRSAGATPQGTPPMNALSASAIATPLAASASASSMSVQAMPLPPTAGGGGGNGTSGASPSPSGTTWTAASAGHPPTLTITTTHTIALHDHQSAAGATQTQTHMHTDIELQSRPSARAAAAAVDPAVVAAEIERNLHVGGNPPGFSAGDDELLASPSQRSPLPASPPISSAVPVLNPTRIQSASSQHHAPAAIGYPHAVSPGPAGVASEPSAVGYPRDAGQLGGPIAAGDSQSSAIGSALAASNGSSSAAASAAPASIAKTTPNAKRLTAGKR